MKFKVDILQVFQAVTIGHETKNSYASDDTFFIEFDFDTGFFLIINKKKGFHRFVSHTNAMFWSLTQDEFEKYTDHLRANDKPSVAASDGKKLSEAVVGSKAKA